MKPSHFTTPRQLSDCTFPVGNPEITRIEHAGHSVLFWLSAVGLGVVCGLLMAGVL